MTTNSEVNGKKTTKRFSVSEIANMTTLKPEELEEAEAVAEAIEEGEETPEISYMPNSAPVEEEEKSRMEHTGKQVSLVSKPSVSDMFRFMLRHTYLNFIGIVGIVISIAAIVLLCVGYGRESTFTTVLMIVVALLFTVVSPLNIYMKAKRQSASAQEEGRAITYTASDAGMDMFRGEEYASFTWDKIYRIIEGKTGFYIYLAANQAFILPFSCFENEVDDMRQLMLANVEPKKCRGFKK